MSIPELCSEHAAPILERHNKAGVSEAEIGVAIRDFLINTGLVDSQEVDMEQKPSESSSGRVDLRTRDLIIEFKVRIGNQITPDPDHVQQLDDYLKEAVAGGEPQRFGILTDGKYWILRWPGMGPVSTQSPNAFTLTTPDHGLQLFEWLRDQSQALEPRGISPTEDEVRKRLGAGPRFEQHLDGLRRLYEARQHDPTVQVKRELWRRLLAAALGEVVEQTDDLDDLFLRHTYLSAMVGLALQRAFQIDITAAAAQDPEGLLGGRFFHENTGLSGVVESDFFTWPVESGPVESGGEAWLRGLAARVDWFAWAQPELDVDIARVLYEAVIPAADRKRLGEYYTPDWLARAVVDELVTDPLNQRVLDPACGSGSFIHAAVRKYLDAARAAGLSPAQRLDGLLNHVIGIDVHPVAVHLARATWTFAARDALEAARDTGAHVAVTVPVYLGDSLQLRTESESGQLFSSQTVSIAVDAVEEDLTLEFPRALVEQADWFDGVMAGMAREIELGGDPRWTLDAEGIEGAGRAMLERTAETLQRLHAEGRDHIWAYYVRNLVRPVALRNDPVDVIVGNPPWLTYNSSEAVVREELEAQSKERYGIWQGGRYATHQDVAGFFYARSVDLYLKPGGVAGMVLPHSALQTGQYQKWRLGDWGQLAVDLQHAPPWDLERIEPNTFFPVPACVAFLRRRSPGEFPKRLGQTASRWRGPEAGPYTRESVPLTDTAGEYLSPYGDRARQGATIVPRILFFVEPQESTALVQADKTITVSPRRSAQEKQPWKSLNPDEINHHPIEAEHVFDVHLGETLAPYVLLNPLKAVLPLSKDTGELRKQDDGWYGLDPHSLGDRMRRRWKVVNELWEKHKSRNNKLSLIERLDYFGNLSSQRPASELRFIYATSGTNPTGAVLAAPAVVLDTSLYSISCDSTTEAMYLAAVFNSTTLKDMLAPLMAKGGFGARHVHKHPWRLPIPEYDDSNDLHRTIAEAGAAAAVGARALWNDIRADREASGKSTSVTVARREIRKWLSESVEGQRVEELVGRLLGG